MRPTHPLFAEAAVELLPIARKEELHARAATVLGGVQDGGILATHLVRAGSAHRPRAVAELIRAGAEASQSLAPASAVELLREAVRLLDAPPPAPEPEPLLLFEAVFSLADALQRAQGRVAAESTYRRAEAVAAQIGDPLVMARAAARHGLEYYTTGDHPRLRAEACRTALAGLPTQDSPLRAGLLAQMAASGLARIDLAQSRVHAAEAVAMARRLNDPTALGLALVVEQGPSAAAQRLAYRK